MSSYKGKSQNLPIKYNKKQTNKILSVKKNNHCFRRLTSTKIKSNKIMEPTPPQRLADAY